MAFSPVAQGVSFDEFWAIVNSPAYADHRLELDDGAIVEVGASSKRNTITASRINYLLSAHVLPAGIGVVTSSDAGFRLPGSTSYRMPDVAFVASAHVGDMDDTYFTHAPDLAVEIVSPDEDVYRKAREYLLAGTHLVWAVYVADRSVHVFRLAPDGLITVQVYTGEMTLDAEPIVPGFGVRVDALFGAG